MKRDDITGSSKLISTRLFEGTRTGVRLIVLGAVHGNEVCGTIAIDRVIKELMARELEIIAGRLTLVPVTNRLAYERRTRNGNRNLNRKFRPTATPRDNEDRITNELCPLLAAHDVLLDLHSFGAPGAAFVLLGPENNTDSLQPFEYALEEEALAERLGISRVVDGWLAANVAGARWRGGSAACVGTTDYMRSIGGYGVTLECGLHTDHDAPEVAYRAIRRALAHFRLIEAEEPERKNELEMLRICEGVPYASATDRFVRKWNNFDPLHRGDLVGYRGWGAPVVAPDDGFIVFPNAVGNPGTQWFYFAQRHPRLSKGRTP